MINWNNLDTLTSFKELSEVERVNLAEVMSGENGAERVKDYSVPMTEDLTYNYAAKAVDDKVLAALAKLAKEAQLTEKVRSTLQWRSDQHRRKETGSSSAHPWTAWR